MADIIGSLFGLSVPELEAQRRQRMMDENEQFALMQAKNSPAPGMTYNQAMLGRSLGQAIGGALFGVQDPMIQRATQLEGILKQTQDELGADASDPFKLYSTLSRNLGQNPELSREAVRANQMASQAQKEQVDLAVKSSDIAKNIALAKKAEFEKDPKMALFYKLAEKSTPASVKAAVDGNYDISLLDSPDKQKLSSKAQELVDAGFILGTPEFNAKMLDSIDSDISGKKKGSATNVSVSIDSGKMAETAGKKVGEKLADIPTQLKAKEALQGGLTQLDQGINSGAFANIKSALTKYTGGVVGSQQKVENTEVYKSYIGNVVIPMMAQLGGNDSNEELKKMEAIVAGDVTLEEQSMRRILKNAQAAIDRDIARSKSQESAALNKKPAPVDEMPSPKPTKRWNAKTGKLEVVK